MKLHHLPASNTRLRGLPRRGVTMIVVLMFLLAVTGIAIFSARYALFGEGMARNQLDLEVARQAAEAALRDAERDLRLVAGTPQPGAACPRNRVPDEPLSKSRFLFNEQCAQGQCFLDKTLYAERTWKKDSKNDKAEPWWPSANGGLWNDNFDQKPGGKSASCTFNGAVPLGTYTGVAQLAGVARQPEYLIEFLSTDANKGVMFRISARGFGYSENTQVLLQSYFVPPEES
ncbi:MAG: pilus assembly protein PilX [Aquabacterium sp.]|jgi:type IV pilus assembly protein PilX|nr:MAG: pilus assembly protein PilX [Aquabacterium sp.]TAL20843.1 MAG: pilus assembly protein PilX [Aquabacterium sp.]